jgi:hypothetical protein
MYRRVHFVLSFEGIDKKIEIIAFWLQNYCVGYLFYIYMFGVENLLKRIVNPNTILQILSAAIF